MAVGEGEIGVAPRSLKNYGLCGRISVLLKWLKNCSEIYRNTAH